MADLSDEALRRVYAYAKRSFELANHDASGVDAGLRAVSEYAARAQRDMEPTDKMLNAGSDLLMGVFLDMGQRRPAALRCYKAMQRAAPLVTEAKP